MVTPRRPSRPERIVVKASGPRRKRPAARHCLHVTVDACGAALRSEHSPREDVCDCHERGAYNPRHDPTLDLRVLCALHLAHGEPVNLYSVFGCDSTWANQDAFRHSVERLNAAGFVHIVGVRSLGYKMVSRRPEHNAG